MGQRTHSDRKCYNEGMRQATLRNGTIILVRPCRTVIVLPCGKIVRGEPQGTSEQAQTALDLGYGEDVGAMVTDHDPLHAIATAILGLPFSFSLMAAAGLREHEKFSQAEESYVLAMQRFAKMCEIDIFRIG